MQITMTVSDDPLNFILKNFIVSKIYVIFYYCLHYTTGLYNVAYSTWCFIYGFSGRE